MLGMLSAEGAILTEHKFIAGVFLVLHRIVVSLLAFLASKSDFYACVCSHLRHLLYNFCCLDFSLSTKPKKIRLTPEIPDAGRLRNTGAEILHPVNLLRLRLRHASLKRTDFPIRTGRVIIAQQAKQVNKFCCYFAIKFTVFSGLQHRFRPTVSAVRGAADYSLRLFIMNGAAKMNIPDMPSIILQKSTPESSPVAGTPLEA